MFHYKEEPQINDKDRFLQAFGNISNSLAKDIPEYFMKKEEESRSNKAIKELTGRDVSGLPNDFKKIVLENDIKAMAKKSELDKQDKENEDILNDIESRRGLNKGDLKAYKRNPKLAEQITRPEKEPKKTQASQPIDPDQLNRINSVRNSEDYEELSPAQKYRSLTNAGVSKENADVEANLYAKEAELNEKKFDKSYKANESFIDDTTKSYKAFETDTKPKLLQMQNIPDEDLIGPTAATFLETLGIPLGALENPASELFQKLSLDLLKGLPETYGNRILKVEVDNFLKTIPSLMNSSDGRRMIASNMLKLGEMKEIYYNEMRKQQVQALESNKFPIDFQQRVFDQVKPQIDRINNEFVKLSEIKSVPKGTVPFFTPNGQIKFVPKEHAQWAQENGGRRIW